MTQPSKPPSQRKKARRPARPDPEADGAQAPGAAPKLDQSSRARVAERSKRAAGPEISSDQPNAMGSTVGNASNKGAK